MATPTLLEPPTIISLKPRPHTLKTGRTVGKIGLSHGERNISNIIHITRILRRLLLDATATTSLALNNQATDRTLALISSIHIFIEFLFGPAFVAQDVAAGGDLALLSFVRGAWETGDTYLVPADGTNGFDGGIVGRGMAEDVFADVGPETFRCIVQSRSGRHLLECLVTSILTIISPGYLVSRVSLLGSGGASRIRINSRHFVFLLRISEYLRS
ncbi:hypothetical protein DER45DRAFT_77895 [Fusarium avenaceum]|nr:hypothetical protein DER45DRAFT_77895 [Fusarium avenaceum]